MNPNQHQVLVFLSRPEMADQLTAGLSINSLTGNEAIKLLELYWNGLGLDLAVRPNAAQSIGPLGRPYAGRFFGPWSYADDLNRAF